MTLVDIKTVECLMRNYEEKGGFCYMLEDGGVGLGTVILYNMEDNSLYNFVIKEKYLNEWSSAQTVRKYVKLPTKYMKMIEKVL